VSETIERLERPSPETFTREFVARQRPAIITGVVDEWRARRLWSPEYFRTAGGGAPVKFEVWESDVEGNDPADYLSKIRKEKSTLGSFVELVLAAEGPSRKNYLAQYPVFRLLPHLREHIGSLEPYMGIPGFYPPSLRARLQKEPTLWLGPAGVVSTLHFDSSHNFFVQLYGRKRFVLLPPGESRRVYYPCDDFEFLHFSPVDVERPDLARFPLFAEARRLEFTVEPGEVLFIPVRWWHYVRSLETSVSLNFWWNSVATYLKIGTHLYRHYRRKLLRDLSRRGPAGSKRQTA
jgi:lysine-specific demethylase 8